MPFTLGETLMIAIIAFVGVWAIDKSLKTAGLGSYAIGN